MTMEFDELEKRMIAEMENNYTETVIEHAINPRNAGNIPDADGYGSITGPCGDTMDIWLKVKDNKIGYASFWTDGCITTIACGSMATELIKGKPINDALKITNAEVTKELGGLPKVKRHCSVLAEQALQSALDDYYKKKGIPSPIKLKSEEEMHEE